MSKTWIAVLPRVRVISFGMPRSGSRAGRGPLRERAGLGEPRPQGAAQKSIPHLYKCGMLFSDSLGDAVTVREAGGALAEGGYAHCTNGCMQSPSVCPASGAAQDAGHCASAQDWASPGPRVQRRTTFHSCTSVECCSQTAWGMRWLCAKHVTLPPKEVARTRYPFSIASRVEQRYDAAGVWPVPMRSDPAMPWLVNCVSIPLALVFLAGAHWRGKEFHEAVKGGDIGSVRALLAETPDLLNIRAWRCPSGETPLHVAARHGRKEVAAFLIEKGADVDVRGDISWTPLHLAAQAGAKDVAELLLAKGATVDPRDANRRSPLHLAAHEGHLAIVELLLAKGADVNAKQEAHWTPLFEAAQAGRKDVVELLVARGAEIDSKTKDERWSPLQEAARGGHKEVVKLLVAKGADVRSADCSGRSPLHSAMFSRRRDVREIAEILIASGADVNAKDRTGCTPLHFTAWANREGPCEWPEAAELLIAKGADVNAKDKQGVTPLYQAVMCNGSKVAALLLAHGADPNAPTNGGPTLLRLAEERGCEEVAKLLRERGAGK